MIRSSFLTFINHCFLIAQNDTLGVVKGQLIDMDSQLPLEGANISIKSTIFGTISDE